MLNQEAGSQARPLLAQEKSEAGFGDAKVEILLSAGNYCMQLLLSARRDEIDKAHSKGISSRIDVANVKNLRHVDRKRVVGWLCIGATATLLHLLFAIGLKLPSVLIGQYIGRLSSAGMNMSLSAIWQLGFGANLAMIGHSFWQSTNSAADLVGSIIVANSPQVVVSFICLFFNSILIRQLVADEWTHFLRDDGERTLRVTSPIGLQRSSYFLSLPIKYSIILVAGSIALHWFISQGIFLLQTSSIGTCPAGEWHPEFDVSAREYPALGVILAITLGGTLLRI
ncbi:hypothetical protein GGR53DRAFT_466894 [Hypoxylon sp. FL1150]|nr:hypothetical protein GGR53DRAFT_466894 [Hypoxylon sp. FL1150]